jgi:putative phosphoesterase
MQIAIVSDTHSRMRTVAKVLQVLAERGIHCVLHCGDIEDGPTVCQFEGLETHFVFGNCDTDRGKLRRVMDATGAKLHEPFGHLELAGRKIAWIHGDDQRLFRDVENSGHFDFLFYGHTHHAEQHRTGPTLVVNPGALHRARVKSFALLDLDSGALETVTVEPD